MLKILKTIFAICIISLFSNIVLSKPPIFLDSPEDAVILSQDLQLDLLLVFGAEWCGACETLKNDINNDLSIVEDTIVCYIDIEKRPDFAKEFRVNRIPDCVVYKNKKEIKRRVGYKNKEEFLRWLRHK